MSSIKLPNISSKNSSSNVSNRRDRESKRNRVAFQINEETESLEIQNNLPDRYTPNTALGDYDEYLIQDEIVLEPDLSLFCKTCKLHIHIDELVDHKEYHQALQKLGFKELPHNQQELTERRKHILKQAFSRYMKKPVFINSDKSVEWNTRVMQINASYELIKSYLNNSFEIERKLRSSLDAFKLDAPGDSRIVQNKSILTIGTCSHQNKKHRLKMEDANIILDRFGENDRFTYIGTFDGYDGDVASNKCALNLHEALLYSLWKKDPLEFKYSFTDKLNEEEINNLDQYEQITSNDQKEKNDPVENVNSKENDEVSNNQVNSKEFLRTETRPKNVKAELYNELVNMTLSNLNSEERTMTKQYSDSFRYAYRQMDKLLSRGKYETSKKRWSGATAFTCLLESKREKNESWIHVANCGDVEAIAIINNSGKKSRKNYKLLTRLHTLSDCVRDREHIIQNGGNLVHGSSGQSTIKGLYTITRALGFHGDKTIKNYIHPIPTVRSHKLDPNFICIIVATKGLWSSLTYEKVAEIVLQLLPSYKNPIAIEDRPVSPSVKTILHQYYYERDKKKMKKKSESLNVVKDDGEEESYLEDGQNKQQMIDEMRSPFSSTQSILKNKNTTVNNNYSFESFSKSDLQNSQEEVQSKTDLNEEQEAKNYVVPFYPKSSRSNTVPHELLHNSLHENENIASNTTLTSFNSKDTNERLIKSEKFKSNSDIYPLLELNALSQQQRDSNLSVNHMKNMSKDDLKHYSEVNFSRLFSNENAIKTDTIKITQTDVKCVQVSEHELKKSERMLMEDRVTAKRLDFVEMLSERIVKSALEAGSTENLTVNCILLPGSKI